MDPQKPHREDEMYYVVRGRARMQIGSEHTEVSNGTVIFVEAEAEHRFYDIQEELEVLVFFAASAGELERLADILQEEGFIKAYRVVKDERGEVASWGVEMNPANNLAREGWRASTLKPGDKVTIVVHPLRNNEKGGQYLSIKLPDGTALGDQGPGVL